MSTTSIGFDIFARDRASDKFEKVGRSADGMGSKLKGLGVAAAAGLAVAGTAAVKFGFDAIGAASDLNETLSKSAAIFGKNAYAMDHWAQRGAQTMGLSRAAALSAAAGFGDMFTQIGFAGTEAAHMSRSVLEMSADLGSFNNLETADVADRMAAAFRGEYDSLQAVIPNINAARVESQALAMTGKTVAKELTAQEKAAAVLAIVHKDGAKAMGDFERTSGGLANQQKILAAQFENTKAKIGTALLPMATKFVTFLNTGMGPALKQVGEWTEEHLLPPLLDVGNFIREKVIPAARELGEKVLNGLRGFIDKVSDAINRNQPLVDGIKAAFQKYAELVFQKVIPALAKIFEWALPKLGAAIGFVIDAIGWVAPKLLAMAEYGVKAYKILLGAAMSAFQGILDAASWGLGWIPGLGDKIKGAAEGFTRFRESTMAELDKVTQSIKDVRDAIDGIPKQKDVKINVKVTGMEGLLKGVTKPNGGPANGESASNLGELLSGGSQPPKQNKNVTRSAGAGGFGGNADGGGRANRDLGTVTFVLKDDSGREIQRKLLKLKRENGNLALGLA